MFSSTDEILDALSAPPVPNRDELARKIANDGLVQTRAMQLAIQAYVPEAVREIAAKPSARDALLKRIGAPTTTKPTFRPAEWALGRATVSGTPHVQAQCVQCHADYILPAPIHGGYDGSNGNVTLDAIRTSLNTPFTHCGKAEPMPEEIRKAALHTFAQFAGLEE